MKINIASAAAPGHSHINALSMLETAAVDPVLGSLSFDDVQLCPQHTGMLNVERIAEIINAYPGTRFRLHASPKVYGSRDPHVYASNARDKPEKVQALARASQALNANGYSLHAGITEEASLAQALDNIAWIEDIFGCPVGIEGLYPAGSRKTYWLLNSWDDYATLLKSGVRYAIDLSHLQIVAASERCIEHGLVAELIDAPQCLEIHVSDNNGKADSHKPLNSARTPWWLQALLAQDDRPARPVFYEGMLAPYRPQNRHKPLE